VPESGEDGYTFNFTNRRVGATEVSGTKTWMDPVQRTHDNAAEITLTLTRQSAKQGAKPEELQVKPVWSGNRYTFANLDRYDAEGYTYTLEEDTVPGYYKRIDGMNVTNGLLSENVPTEDPSTPDGTTPNMPTKPEDIPERSTGTPVPRFEAMSDEDLEGLFDMFGYGTPLYGMLGTGDELPLYPFVFGSIGLMALAAWMLLRKRGQAR